MKRWDPGENGRVAIARRLGITAAVAVALGMFAYAFTIGTGGSEEVALQDDAVERFIPSDGSPSVLRQTQIGLDLEPGWTGALSVDGLIIPAEQLNCFDDCFASADREGNPQQAIVFFVPGDGKVIEQLETGRRCATATIWRPAFETAEANGREVNWCFSVD